jgi:hypothetical protein
VSGWSRLVWVPAIVVAASGPVYGTEYLSIDAAQRQAFPGATRFDETDVIYTASDVERIESLSGQKVRSKGEQVWRAQAADRPLGWFIVDHVIGKHLVIDYSVALDAEGRVLQVQILNYRESYGGEVANQDWLKQFAGKTSGDALEVGRDVTNISGATLSSQHVTEGVRRVLAIYQTCLRQAG